MPTKADVLRFAHRKLGVVSVDEALSADQEAYSSDMFDYMLAEIASVNGVSATIDPLNIAQAAVIPLAGLLAVELGQHYDIPTEPRPRALLRVTAYFTPDDSTDRRDTDLDGVVSDDEAIAGLRTVYY